jgi:hypothetical protein
MSEDYTINYMPVFYIGPIRTYNSYREKFAIDPLFFAKKHVDFLNTCIDTPIKTATMVYNVEMPDELKHMATQLTNSITTMESRTIFRPNGGFSYGGWSDVIGHDIQNNISHDYHFLVEDDYIPTRSNFYTHFIERMDEKCPFVCGRLEPHHEYPYVGKVHPYLPSGMIREDACKRIYEKYKEVFITNRALIYPAGHATQLTYLDNYESEGFELRDISDEFKISVIFNCHTNETHIRGNIYGETLIMPIVLPVI